MASFTNVTKYKLLLMLALLLSACQPVRDLRSEQQTMITQGGGLLDVNGTQLYVKVMGEGEPIIMLHGGPGAEHNFFSRYTEYLAEDYQLIYYDQRSTGASIPDTDPAHLTNDNFVEDLEGIRQALKLDKVTLLGWSWGGDLAMLYAMKYPQHLNGIIMVAPGSISSEFDEAFNTKLMERATPEELDALDAAGQKLDAQKNGAAYVEFAKHLLPLFMADKSMINGLEIYIPDNSAKYGNVVGAALWEDSQKNDPFQNISSISVPTLIIHGDEDLIPLASSQQIHEMIPGSQLVVLEGVGHIIFVEAPEPFIAAINQFMQSITQ